MKTNNALNQILILSSYPPRQCGIATYSKDLVDALSIKKRGSFSVIVCALEKGKYERDYPNEVKHVLDTSKTEEYIQLAKNINNDETIKMIFIQHEFGLFKGEYGETLLYFLYALKKPIVITFHTVLPNPSERLKAILRGITDAADTLIVMTKSSKDILEKEYQIVPSKINIIPHGTHLVKYKNKVTLKEKYDCQGLTVLSTFGLININKNIETAIEALPKVVQKFPDVLYLIIGKTHPEVLKNEGEVYRESLARKVQKLGLSKHVRFINQYVEISELLDLLQMTDVYLFTSKDQNQAVSGTFAYAMSCGCPIISTKIPHAKEMLSSDTGILVDFQQPSQLVNGLLKLLSDNQLKEGMSKKAIEKSKVSEWKNVAIQHAVLLHKFLSYNSFVLNFTKISVKYLYRLAN